MVTARKLTAFVGFQIHSAFHAESDMRAMAAELQRRLQARLKVALHTTLGVFPPGRMLWEEVRQAIRNADILIFDISENNPNVMIEVGLAYGFDKQVFLLKNERSKPQYPLPSDISAIYVPYTEPAELVRASVLRPLEHGIRQFLQDDRRLNISYFRSLWGFRDGDDIHIIGSELDDAERRQHPEPNEFIYLSKYGDVDTLVEVLVTMNRLYPQGMIRFMSGNEVIWPSSQFSGNIILVGGPDYNLVTRHFQQWSAFEYVRGQRWEDIYLRDKASGQVFEPIVEEKNGLVHIVDFGLFERFRNPYNSDRWVVMIGGCHTYGVYGAAKAFSFWGTSLDLQYENCKTVVDRIGTDFSFSVFVEVHAVGHVVIPPTINAMHVRTLSVTQA